jgi:hypothetical protein
MISFMEAVFLYSLLFIFRFLSVFAIFPLLSVSLFIVSF